MKYSIEDTTLTALGDAVRAKTSETRIEYIPVETESKTFDLSNLSPSSYSTVKLAESSIPKTIANIKFKLLTPDVKDKIRYFECSNSGTNRIQITTLDENDEAMFGIDYGGISFATYPGFLIKADVLCGEVRTIHIKITLYDADGNETGIPITVANTLTPAQMVEKINNLPPAPPETAFKLTGNCSYKFANNGWDWFIEQHGDKITTENISNANYMFFGCKCEKIPFDINMKTPTIESMFSNCSKLTTIPNVNFKEITYHYTYTNLFAGCYMIQELPDWLGDLLEADYNITTANTGWQPWKNMFHNCTNLRRIPDKVMRYMKNTSSTSKYYYGLFYSAPFYNNQALDELVNIHCDGCELTSNQLGAFCSSFFRAKDITFATEEDGTPCVRNWKSQVMDLGSYQYIGWGPTGTKDLTFDYIPESKKVIDDTTYQALKDDPDWYTDKQAYSRYNHDSAVNTINSLPDTSAYLAAKGGTNTIKFEGASGELTDGGAINTLTDEEIAVAAAKGWTVSLV